MVGLQQILAGNVITCLEPLPKIVSAVSSFGVVEREIFLGLGVTVTEINIKKSTKTTLKKHYKYKRMYRDGMPKSMQTR